MADKKQSKTIDSTIDDFYKSKKIDDLEKVFDKQKSFEESKNLSKYQRTFADAHMGLYNSFKTDAAKAFGDLDDTLLHKNMEKAKEVLTKSILEGYLKKVHKAEYDEIKEIENKGGLKGEDLYQRVLQIMEEHHGGGRGREAAFGDIIAMLGQDKKATVGDVLNYLHGQMSENAQKATQNLVGKHFASITSGYHPVHVRKFLKEKIIPKYEGISIDDHAKINSLGIRDVFQAYKGITEGDWGRNKNASMYGIKVDMPKAKPKK